MIEKKSVYFLMFIIGIIFTLFVSVKDILQNKTINYGFFERHFLMCGIIFSIISLILFLFYKFSLYNNIRVLQPKIYLYEGVLILLLILTLSISTVQIVDQSRQSKLDEWSIGIYSSKSNEPFSFSNNNVKNPVLTYKDVKDVSAKFVADPFLLYDNNKYFLFFEVMNGKNNQGDIGFASSNDGYNWSYEKIVLDEPFHLSYPCVFKYKNEYYMIPETREVKEVRLYKASEFPYNWSFFKTLVEGNDFVDNTIFYYNNTWWLFTQTSLLIQHSTQKENSYCLRLYCSDNLLGPWIEHPKSPIIKNDMNISRPGGNVVIFNNRVVRYAQDCDPYYGNQVWAFEIMNISKTTYEEQMVSDIPAVKGYENWNTKGMHQVSPHKINDTTWIAAVDGY